MVVDEIPPPARGELETWPAPPDTPTSPQTPYALGRGAELGRAAFEAYRLYVGGSTFDGRPIPEWDALTAMVRHGWQEAAMAVVAIAADALLEDERP